MHEVEVKPEPPQDLIVAVEGEIERALTMEESIDDAIYVSVVLGSESSRGMDERQLLLLLVEG